MDGSKLHMQLRVSEFLHDVHKPLPYVHSIEFCRQRPHHVETRDPQHRQRILGKGPRQVFGDNIFDVTRYSRPCSPLFLWL